MCSSARGVRFVSSAEASRLIAFVSSDSWLDLSLLHDSGRSGHSLGVSGDDLLRLRGDVGIDSGSAFAFRSDSVETSRSANGMRLRGRFDIFDELGMSDWVSASMLLF